ncbi:MAG TPA: hypothetical protein VF041_09190 [Gemmatimonadaceae bacterium]
MLSPRRERERGATLAELLVALVLFASVGGAALGALATQQRFARRTLQRLVARRAARDAADALRSDLRPIAPSRGDLLALGATRIEFRGAIGNAVVCAVDLGRSVLHLPPREAAGGALTSWVVPPVAGDTLLVRVPAPLPDAARWEAHVLAADPARGACPLAGGLVASAAESSSAIALRVAPPLSSGVRAGAPVRVVRRERYELYRGGDGGWYLGFTDCRGGRSTPCAVVQPVSGPFAPGGVAFSYRGAAGEETSIPPLVKSVRVLLVGEGTTTSSTSALRMRAVSESVAVTITPRN